MLIDESNSMQIIDTGSGYLTDWKLSNKKHALRKSQDKIQKAEMNVYGSKIKNCIDFVKPSSQQNDILICSLACEDASPKILQASSTVLVSNNKIIRTKITIAELLN